MSSEFKGGGGSVVEGWEIPRARNKNIIWIEDIEKSLLQEITTSINRQTVANQIPFESTRFLPRSILETESTRPRQNRLYMLMTPCPVCILEQKSDAIDDTPYKATSPTMIEPSAQSLLRLCFALVHLDPRVWRHMPRTKQQSRRLPQSQ
jgi:hypothetical protein